MDDSYDDRPEAGTMADEVAYEEDYAPDEYIEKEPQLPADDLAPDNINAGPSMMEEDGASYSDEDY